MAGLKQIKSKIRSTEKTRKVTKAMEAVSAAKMRKSQAAAMQGRAYARAAAGILARVSGSHAMRNHPLAKEGTSTGPTLYLVITSDKGLAGALNSAVLRAVMADISAQNLSKEEVRILAVGRKANDFFSRRGFTVEAFHQNTGEGVSSDLMQEIVNEAAQRFTTGECRSVRIAYQNLVSTFEQRPTLRTLFPLSLGELERVVHDILPVRGKYAEERPEEENSSIYNVEPSEDEVLDSIISRLASVFVYHALLESQASEHSARMVAMKSASDKAGEMQHALTLRFNKARQAAITREVSEITGGMEAMAE